MQREQILLELDREIAKLVQVRGLLAGETTAAGLAKRKPGRPVGSGKLSLLGRKRIAEAMKRSWAKRKQRAAEMAKE